MKSLLILFTTTIITCIHSQNLEIPHQYIVKLKNGTDLLGVESNFSYLNLIKNLQPLNTHKDIFLIEFHDHFFETNELEWLDNHPDIEFYQRSKVLQPRSPSGCNPNDSYYLSQYDMEIMKFDEAWCYKNDGISPEGDTLVVAVIDRGFNYQWRDLLPNVYINYAEVPDNGIDDDQNGYSDDYYGLNGQNALDGDEHPNDTHGTQHISVIGAKGNNAVDITGTNQNIKMLLCSAGTDAALLKCYYYFIEMKRNYLNSGGQRGAFIVSSNLSAGFKNSFPEDQPLICQVYDSLGKVGILTSVATINDDEDIDIVGDIPGLCPSDYLIVVTNTNRFDQKVEAGYSKINVDLGASGEDIPLIDAQGNVNNASGTSFASPHVAGAVSLLYQYCPKITEMNKKDPSRAVKLIKDFILNCGDDLNSLKNITSTGKRLNMIKSLQCLNSYCNSDTLVPSCSVILKNNLQEEPIEIDVNPAQFGNYNLLIYNYLGQVMRNEVFSYVPGHSSKLQIEIKGWMSGVYYLVIEGMGFKCSQTLIKI